jgi:putative endonuclease
LGERLRVAAGEIDLVARRGRIVAFIEVKWRERPEDLDLAIDQYRLRRVAAAAEMLAPRYARPQDDIRIDVMLLAPGRLPRHLVHVWQP